MVKSWSMNPVPTNQASDPAGSASPSFRPLYQQIKALITQSLQSGEWKPGELMPSEVELAGRFKVSQGRGISSCWVATWFAPRGPAKIL